MQYCILLQMNMKIEHLGIWVKDLEAMRRFYIKYFDMTSGEKYTNDKKGFSSYFLSFGHSKTRLELMHKTGINDLGISRGENMGITHFAISLAGKTEVDSLTERLRADNYTIASEPRTSGDGYYESVILDPEGNFVEIIV